ncbi:hypothetical protein CFC21_086887 [Triticum aestivum]|uniref:Sm protein E n=2 Tax=Triticum aestivum TaxID=4565 RepID=A0A3B6PFR1_WHEAT|nr:hypothetical protein CFC21_086887 [Triticum aestivum]
MLLVPPSMVMNIICTPILIYHELNFRFENFMEMVWEVQVLWSVMTEERRLQARGFDEYMNLVLEDAEEINTKKNTRKSLGRILLKGDNITLMMNTGK